MRPAVIFKLSSVLFKSYLRARRGGKVTLYSHPRVMLIIDLITTITPIALLQLFLPRLPEEMIKFLEPLAWQALVGLPILMTSAIIVAGILFELQSTRLSSSEPVNWLPLSPREYVAASAISTITVYSPLYTVSVGITLPLALEFGLMHVWAVSLILSVLSLLLGAFIVEVLRAAVNRVSSTVYRRSGRFGIASRLMLLIVLFVLIQLAFNPYILYHTLGVIVSGVDLVWFIPMMWPSLAIINLIRLETLNVIALTALSVTFTALVFEAASNLRFKYWSPAPISIRIEPSAEYKPHGAILSRFGFNPLEAAIALKEFRALVRRKDMARFIAIPIIMMVSLLLPTVFTPSGYHGRSPGFFMAMFIPFMMPLMLSMITVGQEGRAVINLYMLPISAREFVKGKILPALIISLLATIGAIWFFEIVAPMGTSKILVTILACIFAIVAEAFIGLGVGARYPDYTAGPRSRYVTFRGFLVGFLLGGISALVIFIPTALHLISSGGIRGPSPIPPLALSITIPLTLIAGLTLSYFAYRYCISGVENLLSNLEA